MPTEVPGRPRESDAPTSGEPGQRDAAAVRVFPPLIPLATVLAGIGLDYAWPALPGPGVPAPARYVAGGLIVIGALLLLGAWSVFLLRRDGQSENPFKPTFRIMDRGPFRITRNPMYLQMLLVCVGLAIVLDSTWILLLTPLCGWLLFRLAIRSEEAYLEKKFGEAYLEYKRRVRRWL